MDHVYRQQALFTRCASCPYQESCDQPIAPCPPIYGRGTPDTRMVSPINPRLQEWIASVGGNLGLDVNFPQVALPSLPAVLPAVARRLAGPPANLPVVGITLSRVLSSQGKFRYPSREHLLQAYGLAPTTKLVLVCVEKDQPLEHLWHNGIKHGNALYRRIATFGFSAAIGPNYSVFLRRSPLEHQLNYKRALIVAANLAEAGLPTVPHVYAAGPLAVDRIVAWLQRHPHITTIARELQTSKNDRVFHDAVVTTQRIIQDVGRPLHVIFLGPRTKPRVEKLIRHFAHFSLVTANAAMLAASYRTFDFANGGLQRRHDPGLIPTKAFEHNSRMVEHAIEHLRRKFTYDENLNTDIALQGANTSPLPIIEQPTKSV